MYMLLFLMILCMKVLEMVKRGLLKEVVRLLMVILGVGRFWRLVILVMGNFSLNFRSVNLMGLMRMEVLNIMDRVLFFRVFF